MNEKIELAVSRARSGAAQLLNAFTILAEEMEDTRRQLIEVERRVAEIQNGSEPLILGAEKTAPVAS